MDALREAQDRLDAVAPGRYEARVLEPSPPPVSDPPWMADDPVRRAATGVEGRPVVVPFAAGAHTWDGLARDDPDLAAWCAPRWLGAWPGLDPIDDPTRFGATLGAWHALAEHVLAAARCAATGKIGLRRAGFGVGTPFFAAGETACQVRVEGAELVVDRGGVEERGAVTTLTAAAAAAGVDLSNPPVVYQLATRVGPDEPLVVDPDAAARLGDWFGFATSVLEELRAGAPDREATRVQIWPEHFDASIDLGDEAAGRRGTFGASPGDAQHPLPYLYVTHWADRPPDGYWNDPAFGGASLGYETLQPAEDPRAAALTFFGEGRERLAAP